MKKLIFWALSVCLAATSYGQELVSPVSLDYLVNNSNVIVEAHLRSKEGVYDANHDHIYTMNTFEVSKIFMGDSEYGLIHVITKGGQLNGEFELVQPSLNVAVGSSGVLFLKANSVPLDANESVVYQTVSEPQGFVKFQRITGAGSNGIISFEQYESDLYSAISAITGLEYTENSSFTSRRRIKQKRIAGEISSFSPSNIRAGAFEELTINGFGFGATQGTVSFTDANDPSSSTIDAPYKNVISWSDSQIRLHVPYRSGTGKFYVTPDGGSAFESQTDITIPVSLTTLSEINSGITDSLEHAVYLVDYAAHGGNGAGGFTFEFSEKFQWNQAAKADVETIFDLWSCNTGMNFDLAAGYNSINVASHDNVNAVYWTDLADNTLGLRSSRLVSCGSDDYYVTEQDLGFDSTYNWNFGSGSPSFEQDDFQTVVIHEVGHAVNLGHVVNSELVMYYSTFNGREVKTIDDDALDGAISVLTASEGISPSCGINNYVNGEITCTTCGVPSNIGSRNVGGEQFTVFWDLGEETSAYKVRYRATGNSSWLTSSTSVDSLIIDGLNSNTEYQFQVRTLCETLGASDYSSVMTVTTGDPSCPVPVNTLTGSITGTSATASWDVVTEAVKYKVQYKISGNTNWNSVSTTSNSYRFVNLTDQTDYEWQIRSFCDNSSSDYTSTLDFTTAAGCAEPTGLNESDIRPRRVTLGWDAVAGASTYKLRLNNGSGVRYYRTSGTSITIGNLVQSDSYTWEIRTICTNDYSGYVSDNFTLAAARFGAFTADVEEIELYPNPAHEQVVVLMPAESSSATFQLINTEGVVALELDQVWSGDQLDVSGMAKGVYTVKIIDETGLTVERLVLE